MVASDPLIGPVLAIDASAPRSAVVVGRLGSEGQHECLAQDDRVDGANQASKTLDHRILELMEAAGLRMDELRVLACGRGPGTFTGTRVSVATMQGIALGLGHGVLALGTLEALAHSLDDAAPGDWVMPLLDARRGEVYAQLFEVDSEGRLLARSEPSCRPLADSLNQLEALGGQLGRLRALGPGVEPYAAQLPANAQITQGPSAKGLWRALTTAVDAGRQPDAPAKLSALYLRATYAELGLNKPKRPVFKNPLL